MKGNITKYYFTRINKLFFLVLLLFTTQLYSQNTGKIIGKVTESSGGSALSGANIIILNSPYGTSTDTKGRFSISKVNAGSYKIKASFLGYQDLVYDIIVSESQVTEIDFTMNETTTELEKLVVYGQLTRGQAKSLNEQKNSPNIINVVSSEQFQLFPDRNAAETVARIPGVSISYDQGEGEMVQIRGIGPEYNSLTINGQRIPAPDPDASRSVGLDLLNQDLIENIIVTKALTADIDGDAIGGNINFQMKQAPDSGMAAISLAGGYNVQHSYFNSYGNDIVDVTAYGGQRFFNNKLGVLLALTYYKTNRGSTLREYEYSDLTNGIIFAQHSNDYDVLRERTGININTEYKFDEFNKIYLNLNHNRYFDKEIRRLNEWIIEDEEETKETRNRVEDQFLRNAIFGGAHNFNDVKLDYNFAWIKAEEDMPARTYFRFQRDFDFSNYSNSQIKDFAPNTKFSDQTETLTLNRIRVDDNLKQDLDISGLLNLEIPYLLFNSKQSFKVGGKYLTKNAKYTSRRLQLRNFPEKHAINEGEFGFENVIVGPDDKAYLGASKVEYLDRSSNNYEATENIIAAYGMTNIILGTKFNILAGLRFENTTNKYKSLAVTSVNKDESNTNYSDILPSLHLNYKLTDNMNLRLAYSTGISRPDYISLVPSEFRDDDSREISKGNPNLKPTSSNNFDLMVENYTSYLGFFSAGIFYKDLNDIIISSKINETLILDGNSQVYEVTMPINGNDNATAYGFELAFNQHLNIVGISLLNNFSIYANYTFTKSEIEIDGRKIPFSSSPKNIANLALIYDNSEIGLSFVISNSFRDNILISVGVDKFNDRYFKSEYHLDISISKQLYNNLKLFLQLNNLTDQDEKEIFGDPNEDYSQIQQWAKFHSYGTLGISYNF